jgi:hypothetical protein
LRLVDGAAACASGGTASDDAVGEHAAAVACRAAALKER